jgi:hypothetical protein
LQILVFSTSKRPGVPPIRVPYRNYCRCSLAGLGLGIEAVS